MSLLGAAGACAHRDPLASIDLTRFELPVVDGEHLALAEQRGKVVVVEFFATWCFPCVAEAELMQKLHDHYPTQVEVVAIGVDLEGIRALRPFRDQLQITYPILVADDEVISGRSPFGRIEALPTTFIVDKSGRVRDGFVGLAPEKDLRALIDRLISE